MIPFITNFKSLDAPSKWIFAYVICSVVFATGSWTINKIFGNNMWFFSMMHVIQFGILSAFYWYCIKNPAIRSFIKFMPFVMLVIFSLDIFKLEGIKSYNSISAGFKSIVILAYGAIYFLQLLQDKSLLERSIYINSLHTFWYNAGIFLYSCTSFFFTISYNLVQGSKVGRFPVIRIILSTNYIVATITMILLYIGLTKYKKSRYAAS
ncbi:MAG TPA: hypothetical protein VM802_00670 [Chitinophaga sp.]|uniref:hypothetical protein n=1 Tax=Chitinophaga sp. TaxID=1869181 RepID=UPI002BC4B13F|nr:hypothetical protein [Chitinophaga sp.]HVI43343.1 hypothetical protein [Chitinophaga sp.]